MPDAGVVRPRHHTQFPNRAVHDPHNAEFPPRTGSVDVPFLTASIGFLISLIEIRQSNIAL